MTDTHDARGSAGRPADDPTGAAAPDADGSQGSAHASGRPENRLATASSPYLLLHRHNPVDWYPWGEEALERARREDKPIFLSVGYSTCYWCHVMERESFSNPEIAAAMNEGFVNVKLDREERPDLDEVYMVATQLMTGHGGWPNSVFLTPQLAPFFAGTYFPPEDRGGRPGFGSLLAGVARAWQEQREQVDEQAHELVHAIGHYLEHRLEPAAAPPSAEVADASVRELARRFDATWGGFGEAPKFPSPANLLLLLEYPDDPDAARMLATTLDRMLRGGIYDQLGGGFHRYATDREWRVPHFEKMLYDNGALLEVYARAWERDHDPELARVVTETVAFLERELSAPEGGFWSAIDAETHGREGAFHVWTREELAAVLGEEDLAFLAPLYGFDRPPFFEEDHYVLHLPRPLAEQAERRRTGRDELLAAMAPLRERLFAAREQRRRPLTDDKVLADWNGLAIAGLAAAGRALERPDWLARAARAADFVLTAMRPTGTLLHAWRGGEGEVPAFLADYAFVVHGLLELHAATGERRWRDGAADLAAEQRERLAHEDGGYYTAAARPDLLFRSREIFDGASPSANGVAVLNLLRLAEATGEGAWRAEAERALRAFAPLVEAQPAAARTLGLAARRFHGAGGGSLAVVTGAPEERPAGSEPTTLRPAQAGPVALEEEAVAVVGARLLVEPPATGESGATDPAHGEWRRFRLRLEVAPGWHLTGVGAPAGLLALALEEVDCELRGVAIPPPAPFGVAEGEAPLPVHSGRLEIAGELRPILRAGKPRVRLRYQACDDRRCLPAVDRVVEGEDSGG
jgi:uncharacterized protein